MKTMMMQVMAVAGLAVGGGCAVDEGAEEAATESMTEQAASTSSVWTSNWNGSSADVGFWDGLTSGHLSVYEGGSKSNKYTYLNFSTSTFDPTSETCYDWFDPWSGETYSWCYYTRHVYTYGWGELPSGDATITRGAASVHTTIGANLSGERCTYDHLTWESSCEPLAPGGQIDVTWRKDGSYSMFSSGTQHQTFGPYSFKSQGTFRQTSARASGSVLGTTFDGAYGGFGDTRGVNVSRSVILAPPTP